MKREVEATPTIHDVARRANVGAATVSRVLNNTAPVSEATRQVVMKAIAELNYSPSQAARKFSLGKTLIISIIIPFFTRPSFVERLRGVDSVLSPSQYDFIVYNVDSPEKRDQFFNQVPRKDRSDGVIIIGLSITDEYVSHFRRNDIPVVLVDSKHPALSSVAEDSVQGGDDATQHLISLGHERIAYIDDILNDPLIHTSNASRNRLIGYRRALDRAGIKFRPEYHHSCYQDRPSTRALAREVLSAPNRPSAIFAACDTQALGILEAARDLGLQVPEELSVIGYDDIEIAEYAGLTTMRQSLFESGRRGAELMLQALDGSLSGLVIEPSPTTLVVRSSTCPPAKSQRRVSIQKVLNPLGANRTN
jgi:DNA-binding LacI/PurR family transcriptional regulator